MGLLFLTCRLAVFFSLRCNTAFHCCTHMPPLSPSVPFFLSLGLRLCLIVFEKQTLICTYCIDIISFFPSWVLSLPFFYNGTHEPMLVRGSFLVQNKLVWAQKQLHSGHHSLPSRLQTGRCLLSYLYARVMLLLFFLFQRPLRERIVN